MQFPTLISQPNPSAQSLSPEHAAPQLLESAQTNGSHVVTVSMHPPAWSHALVCSSVPRHVGPPHEVPAAYLRHAPAPSHSPSPPQVAGASGTQSSSGSVPFAIAPHAPSLPDPFFAALHASQVPAHADSQQTPSAQKPERHSPAEEHAAPMPFSGTHADALQKLPGAHSSSVVQVTPHVEPLHAYVPQLVLAPGLQVPAPSQLEAASCWPASHDAGEQTVPARCFLQRPAPSHVPSSPQDGAP